MWIVCYKMRVGNRVRVFWVRDEYAANDRASATRFDTITSAEREAEVIRQNIGARYGTVVFNVIEVTE
jgi:hypothetical protein